jgi:hypothetical protein
MEETLTEQESIDRDLDLWDAERQWRRSLPRHSDAEWLHIFPEAVKKWGPILIRRMKLEKMFTEAHIADLKYDTKFALLRNTYDWRDDLIKDHARRQLNEMERQLRALDGRIAYIRSMQGKKVDGVRKRPVRLTEDMIATAKKFPIEQLIEVNRAGFAKCLWHTDTRPSMFCKKNFCHCFVCQKSADTIEIVMEKEGLSFKDSVMRLQ